MTINFDTHDQTLNEGIEILWISSSPDVDFTRIRHWSGNHPRDLCNLSINFNMGRTLIAFTSLEQHNDNEFPETLECTNDTKMTFST